MLAASGIYAFALSVLVRCCKATEAMEDLGAIDVCEDVAQECFMDANSLLQVNLRVEKQKQLRRPSKYYRQVLYNEGDLQYSGDIKLDGQPLRAILDTGSYEILAFAQSCDTCGLAGWAGFSGLLSSTYESGSLVQTQVFGSGSATSYDGSDSFEVGPFRVEHQDFWLARTAAMPVLDFAVFQVIVGLGPPGEPELYARQMQEEAQHRLTFFRSKGIPVPPDVMAEVTEDLLVARLVLDKNDSVLQNIRIRYFSSCLQWASGSPGYLIWNDVPPQEQSVTFTPVSVTSQVSWGVQISSVQLKGPEGVIQLGCQDGCQAVMDTGTSLISVPKDVYELAFSSLQNLNANCGNMEMMPDLVFYMGGHNYTLPPQAYVGVVTGMPTSASMRQSVGRGSLGSVSLSQAGAQRAGYACELLLLDSGIFGNLWIVGMPFFRYYYTTFDLGAEPLNPAGRKVWTAPATANCHPSDSPDYAARLSLVRRQPPSIVNASLIRTPSDMPRTERSGSVGRRPSWGGARAGPGPAPLRRRPS